MKIYSGSPDGSLSAAYILLTSKAVTNAYTWTSADGKQTVGYNMTTGHINVAVSNAQKGIVTGSMLYRAYVQTPQANSSVSPNRPITFIYNGGPGSSADYLQAASFGPKSVVTSMPNQKTQGFGSGAGLTITPTALSTIPTWCTSIRSVPRDRQPFRRAPIVTSGQSIPTQDVAQAQKTELDAFYSQTGIQ